MKEHWFVLLGWFLARHENRLVSDIASLISAMSFLVLQNFIFSRYHTPFFLAVMITLSVSLFLYVFLRSVVTLIIVGSGIPTYKEDRKPKPKLGFWQSSKLVADYIERHQRGANNIIIVVSVWIYLSLDNAYLNTSMMPWYKDAPLMLFTTVFIFMVFIFVLCWFSSVTYKKTKGK
jgi:hypothetical protein